MRIDVHAYIGHWPFRPLPGNTAGALVRRMDELGIDQAWVGHIHGIFYKNAQNANEELLRAIEPFRDRLVPWAVLNPTYADWEHDIEVCVRDLDMRGIRLYPQYHGYRPGDNACMAIVNKARALGLPVAFTQRLVDERQQSWLDPSAPLKIDAIADAIAKAPEARYLILHAFPDTIPEERKDLFRNATVLFDTIYASGTPIGVISAYSLSKLTEVFGIERFAFGTASPFRDPISPVLRLRIWREGTPSMLDAVWHGNAQRFQAQ